MRCFLSIVLALLSLAPMAKAASLLEIRQAEKIALTLTGLPLSKDLRDQLLQGKIDLKSLAETLSTSPGFIEYFAQYWTRTLNIQSAINPYALKSVATGATVSDDTQFADWNFIAYPPNAVDQGASGLTSFYNHRASGAYPPAIQVKYCSDMPTLTVVAAYNGRDAWKSLGTKARALNGKPVKAGTEQIWKKLWDLWQQYDLECGSGGVIMNPWWDPDTVTLHARYKNAPGYRVPPMIAKACGPNLSLCDLRFSGAADVYMDEVSRAMTMEAGYLIAHVVAEDAPFSDVLTTDRTIMTGSYLHFMSRPDGQKLKANFPGGSYFASNPAGDAVKANDTSHYWVDRNDLHAGILTTPIYQLLTNGRRAKANRAYETFLCRKFVVPDGAKANPADSNPDLTQRAYCSYCHKTIEPLAAFFNAWPLTGTNNYEYNAKADDEGAFYGESGRGAKGLGKIIVDIPDFQWCAAKRAFEFVNRRKMTATEETNNLQSYLDEYGTDKNLRRVIIKMLLDSAFLNPKGS